MRILASVGLIAYLAIAGAGAAVAAQTAAVKDPPSCAAIAFRPIASGMTDGTQDAGLYKSRFGRIELKATVKSGEAQDYFVEVGGKQPTAITAAPAGLAACAQSKKLPPAGSASAACTGDRFMVVVDHAGKDRLFALYARQGSTWHFCRAGTG